MNANTRHRTYAVIGTAALLATLPLMVPVASDASAHHTAARRDSVTVHDEHHDILAGPSSGRPAPKQRVRHRAQADVVSLHSTYQRHRIRVRFHFAKLRRNAHQTATYVTSLRTSRGRHIQFLVLGTGWPHSAGSPWLVTGHPGARCPGAHGRVDYHHDVVRVSIPSTCVHDAGWVEVGAGSAIVAGSKLYADDAVLGHRVRPAHPAYGPRIHRR